MIKGIYSSASGMQYLHLKQEVSANNIANMNTTGFKKEGVYRRSLFSNVLLMVQHATDFVNLEEVDEVKTLYTQGPFITTNSPLDIAIEGSGFLVTQTPTGLAYTRNGNLTLDGDGILMTTNGYPVLDQQQQQIQIVGEEVFIDDTGNAYVDDVLVSVVQIVDFPKPYNLVKIGDGLFRPLEEQAVTPEPGSFRIRQGVLEDSNVNPIEEMVTLISNLRNFDSNQQAIRAQDSTLDRAVNDVGRIRG